MLRNADTSSRRHVWIVNHYAGPPRRGGGTRHHDLARQLYLRGHAVTIFASSVSHFGGPAEAIPRMRLYRTEMVEDVRYVWIRGPAYGGNSGRRFLNMVSFAILALVVQARFQRPNAVIGSTVHPLAAAAGYLMARLRRAKFFFEVRDLWPQTLIDMGALAEASLYARALRWIEAFLMTHGDGVISLLPGMDAYLRERGLHPGPLLYLPNGVDLSRPDVSLGPQPQLPECLAAWRAASAWICVYLGAHGRANNLSTALEAARILQKGPDSRVRLLLVGDGPEKAALVERAAELGLKNVSFADPVAKRHVPSLLAAVDAGLVQVLRTPIYRYGMSFNKLFDYMANRKPVVFACETASDPVAEHGAGFTVPPENPEALAAALRRMSKLPQDELDAMGQRGLDYVREHHDTAVLGSRLADYLEAGRG